MNFLEVLKPVVAVYNGYSIINMIISISRVPQGAKLKIWDFAPCTPNACEQLFKNFVFFVRMVGTQSAWNNFCYPHVSCFIPYSTKLKNNKLCQIKERQVLFKKSHFLDS